ncbi:Tim10/DDP family zinc finger-domain-containing protein [Daldinia decipiens]|uniref:Mitochondrial import inner membrane translocase subunit TIM13 n=1 Tax=Daldinia childiae TaxID=326645 RepID=UPI0014463F01|nr:Mitochondrial import inner membrane translocase subunit TIM13 [Daldinia childiae]XP_049103534.1 Tim10/DDP family zinc finger-domain-containing protein [Daldinia decipiens]KAF3065339.1 Mitochondrial import inner membrane translocase subunit TIM13 [Daldinia childiae]KAI1661569.1 Tim10/DDP family zinc finger-domain-containing protein [Daldinia decipiens]
MDSSESIKAEVIKQVKTQYALENARLLIEKINEHCFERCVPKPGPSISSSESTCFTQCMEKYMSAWNSVSSTYIDRLRREQ